MFIKKNELRFTFIGNYYRNAKKAIIKYINYSL